MEDSGKAQAAEGELKKYGQLMDDLADRLGKGLKHKQILKLDGHVMPNVSKDNILQMTSNPVEGINLQTLIMGSTDNAMLGKVILALAAITEEMNFLMSDEEMNTKFLDPLLLYGSEIADIDQGEAMVTMSRLLPVLNELSCYVDHCAIVVRNVVHQLSALFGDNPGGTLKEASIIGVTDVHFQVVFESLGRLLTGLITLDELVCCHPLLRDHWGGYKRMLKAAQLEPLKYGLPESMKDKLKRTEKLITPIEAKVMEGNMFKTCVEQNFNTHGFQVTKNSSLSDELLFCLRSLLAQVENEYSLAGSSNFATLDPDNPLKLVGLTALIVLHHHIFQMQDKKFVNKYWEVCKKVPGLTLYGNVMWFPDQFLASHAGAILQLIDRKHISVMAANRQNLLQNKAQSGTNDVKQIQFQVNSWIVRMENGLKLEVNKLTVEHLQSIAELLMQGIYIALNISTNVKTVLNLHRRLSIPLSKTSAIVLCKLVELLKCVELTYTRHALPVMTNVNHICQHQAFLAISTIEKAKRSVVSDKRYSRASLDTLSAMLLAQKMICGPPTLQRKTVARLAMAFSSQNKSLKDEDYSSLLLNFRRISTLCRIQENISKICDASFLFWHKVILPANFDFIFENDRREAYRLPYIFMALNDSSPLLALAKHLQDPKILSENFETEIRGYLKQKILLPLCASLETDLRLQAHSHLQLDDLNPFRRGVKNVECFLQLPNITFFKKEIDIKAYVEAYLEKTFYNLTTLALHDWRTYGEMRALAKHKFGAETGDDLLPSQTLEQLSNFKVKDLPQGMDVIDIMRNINVFVSSYLYNLNNQIFIEKTSPNKHLNTINIGHVSNSIRTHGTGVMNTAVNFTYQFLRKKFSVFSQFLYDEQIKSRLSKDMRYFKENGSKFDQKFPYDRASKFNRGIRKLGSPDGVNSYLDQFRMLITQIGNALGYVRMVRSGGLHSVSNSIRFVPDLEDIQNFEKITLDEGITDPEVIEAAKTLDEVVGNLTKSFTEGSEYFQLLVNVFSKQLKSDKHSHLKNFYVIVPALTINFVDNIIAAKDRITKKDKQEAAFTDDGMAMGIAYILRLLDQCSDYDSLHWFQSVGEMYRANIVSVRNELKQQTQDPKLQQTLELKLKRLHTEQKEFELLHYSLSSAGIFFRPSQPQNFDEKEDEKKDE